LTLAYDLCEASRRRRRRRKTRSKRKACHALSFLRRSCGGVAVTLLSRQEEAEE
jgi:hypothetical protein